MSKCIRLAVFTFFAAFVFIMCGESHARPGMDGIDEHGRRVNVVDVDSYLKQNPYRPPAKKKAPAKKPAPKKPAPKPKPKPKAVPKKSTYTKFDLDDAIGDALIGGGVAAGGAAIISGGSAAPLGGLVGGGGAFLNNAGKWAWKNKRKIYHDAKQESGKIAEVEDPMGKSFPH